jgi:hypothetical protein
MEFSKPQHNSFGFYRVQTTDAEGRRISVKERGVHRNQTRLDIISQLQTVTLTQEDAAELAKLLYHYANNGTIADYDEDFALIDTSEEFAAFMKKLRAAAESFAGEMQEVIAALDEEDILDDELTVGAQPERVAWVRHNDGFYAADMPSGAVLRVQWEEEGGAGGWVGRCGCAYTNPQHTAIDAKDQIMAHYLDAIERDIEQLKASLP